MITLDYLGISSLGTALHTFNPPFSDVTYIHPSGIFLCHFKTPPLHTSSHDFFSKPTTITDLTHEI